MPMSFSIKNSSGSMVSLLSDPEEDKCTQSKSSFSTIELSNYNRSTSLPDIKCGTGSVTPPSISSVKDQEKGTKKFACTFQNCVKSFSTSGHLARHARIHTGEKNFRCLLPECSSRFSRQDNMMQHYRTHFLTKSKANKIRIYPHPDLINPNHPYRLPPLQDVMAYRGYNNYEISEAEMSLRLPMIKTVDSIQPRRYP